MSQPKRELPSFSFNLADAFRGDRFEVFITGAKDMRTDASDTTSDSDRHPDKKIRAMLAAGLGIQLAGMAIPGTVLIPTVVFRAAGEAESLMLWAVFASVMICGVVTILQAVRVGRIGAGYILVTGTSGASIAVSIAALTEGGPALLAVLVLVLSFFQFVFSARLALFRQILTPTVMGTVLMLTPVTVMPVIFDQLKNVPAGAPPSAAPLSTLATLLVIAVIVLKAKGPLRLWAPVIGIVAGSIVAGAFGLYDVDRVAEASWVGLPSAQWPGYDLNFGPAFWGLLPAFLFIAVVCTIQTISGSVAVQRVSWSAPRAVDFRTTQGAVAGDVTGNLLSSLAGTMPIGFRPTGTSMIELTGISSRQVGVAYGAVAITLAFLPKALAVILAIPGPVIGAFITVMMATIFVIGMRIIVQDGIDYRKGTIAGVSFWVGVGFQNGVVFPEYITALAGPHLHNGMVAGGLVAIVMTLFVELTKPRRSRIEVELDVTALENIRKSLAAFASRSGWDTAMANRLDAVSEEALLTLMRKDETGEEPERRRLLLTARKEDDGAILEFVASTGGGNLQDRLALLGEQAEEDAIEQEVSLRLLRHLASWVRHQQYHDTDIVTVRVEAPGRTPAGRT
ncbi:MAG: hypothetical protein OXL68_08705 [Paracoccaceae bacterium]|nr:hypothetical protein [Paracoccaceae bacterium]